MTKNTTVMRISRNILFSVLLIMLLVSPLVVLAQNDNAGKSKQMKANKEAKKVTLSMDGFQIEVNAGGEVPFYHFNTTAAKFFFKFQKIIQYADANGNGVYDEGEAITSSGGVIALTSVDWNLVILTDTNESKEFSFNSTNIRQPGFENAKIALINHFEGSNPAVKFDVIVQNWPFAEGATGLALEFEVTWQEEANLVKEVTDNAITIKDSNGTVHASFDIVSNIVVDGSEVTDGAHLTLTETSGNNDTKVNVYINYPTFSSSLEHDPTISTTFKALGNEAANPSTIFQQIFGELNARNVIGGFAVITVVGSLAVLSLLWFNKKKK